jgi:hypothetical protein
MCFACSSELDIPPEVGDAFSKNASRLSTKRAILNCIAFLCGYEKVMCWKLDRLSRSLKDVLTLMEKDELASAEFQCLTEAIDTQCLITGYRHAPTEPNTLCGRRMHQ